MLAEASQKLQPQGHYVLAGMQTTATYYGAMNSYRTGRHVGRAIRPREKLGGGIQGKVRRIPSSTKGKRAHPHMIEKIIKEQINKKEYQKAIASAVAATASKTDGPIVIANQIEQMAKTREIVKVFNNLKLTLVKKKRLRQGLRRHSNRRRYTRSVLLVLSDGSAAIRAAANIAGVDACSVNQIKASLLAPGGVPGRLTVWSEAALKNLDAAIKNMRLS